MKKAATAFLVGRPYGMRVDFKRKGYVLFNRRMNILGNEKPGEVDSLPLEGFEVERIPLNGERVERGFYGRVLLQYPYGPIYGNCTGFQ